MSQKFLIFSSVVFALILAIAGFVLATSKKDIVFPVAELDNCASEQECRLYCDSPDNMEACLKFAEQHNLIKADELTRAKKFLASGRKGPGGCGSKLSCETYCNDIVHMKECLAFAERHGLMSPEELQEAKKVKAALDKGAQLPGGCTNKEQCEEYCSDPAHMEECIAFAEAAGFIPPDELAEARKVLAAIRKGARPPPCRGKQECDNYCQRPEHMGECLVFAEAAGLIPPEELADAKKSLAAIKKGVKPPNCRGRGECDVYCSQEEHFQECLAFAEAAGFMSSEEAAMARKTGGKGPGGCKGREECDAFCNNPDHQEICFNFAKEHDLLSPQDLQRIEEGRRGILRALQEAPPRVAECILSKLGSDKVQGLKAGTGLPGPQMGENIRACFEQFKDELVPPGQEMQMPEGSKGPGGCAGPQECMDYCRQNPQECQGFKAPAEQESSQPEIERPEQEQDAPSPEQIRQQIQERMQRQMEQQMRQQIEQQLQEQSQGQTQPEPQPADQPQSLLRLLLRTAAGLLYLITGK